MLFRYNGGYLLLPVIKAGSTFLKLLLLFKELDLLLVYKFLLLVYLLLTLEQTHLLLMKITLALRDAVFSLLL